MPNYLYINDPTPNDGFRHEHYFTGYINNDGTIVGTNVRVIGTAGAWLDGNDLSGSIGLTLEGNSTLEGELRISNFDTHIFGSGTGNHVLGSYSGAIESLNARTIGVAVSGGATVTNVTVDDMINPTGNAFGFVGWGGGNNFWHNNVSNINGYSETVGLSMAYGGDVYDFNATVGEGHTGWSFGFWAGTGGSYTVEQSSFVGFDTGIGNVEDVTLTDTEIEALAYDISAHSAYIDNGGNSLSISTPQSGTITGTSSVDHLLGDAAASSFLGGGAADVMYGGLGGDTFIFTNDGQRVILPDYDETTGDSIDLGDFDPLASFTFNNSTHEFLYNGSPIAYIPHANSLSDLTYFL